MRNVTGLALARVGPMRAPGRQARPRVCGGGGGQEEDREKLF